jgi:hypothetical protein
MSDMKHSNRLSELTNETNTCVRDDVLLVSALDVLVIHRFSGLGVHPAGVKRAVLETPIEVLDMTHHPRHLDASLDRELPTRLHLPSRARAAPGTNFCEASNYNHLLKVEHATKLRKVLQ